MVGKEEETISQEQQEHYVIRSSTPNPTTLIIRQLPSQGLSFQLWPAASTLMSFLDQSSSSSSNSPFLSSISQRPIRILELGSGTGLVGIAAAAILGAHVTITDLPHVLPNLQFNANTNATAVASNSGVVDVRCLRWGEPEDMASIGHQFHLLLASDVVYHDHLFHPLLQTLSFFLQGDVGLVMAHLRRWKKDSAFFKKAKKLFDVTMIHRDDPLPGSRTGVVVYHFAEKGRNKTIMEPIL
ncbi:uncharacterized protein LOC131225327 isoform X2 [Magnolia sinica]|nr:uncharacterized protein LOC131225327 isoform X2 [Magnolia sinica]